MSKRDQMGAAIVQFEGRFDKNGNLMVYKLPAGDGGGTFEVAGINDRYHPTMANHLKRLIEAKKYDQARREAGRYIIEYTDVVLKWFGGAEEADKHPHVEFLLRDSVFNRGPKGSATILQIALRVKPVDGVIGPKTKAEFQMQLAINSDEVALRITQARETYERNSYPWKIGKRNESSKFWTGLSNRWSSAHIAAMKLIV